MISEAGISLFGCQQSHNQEGVGQLTAAVQFMGSAVSTVFSGLQYLVNAYAYPAFKSLTAYEVEAVEVPPQLSISLSSTPVSGESSFKEPVEESFRSASMTAEDTTEPSLLSDSLVTEDEEPVVEEPLISYSKPLTKQDSLVDVEKALRPFDDSFKLAMLDPVDMPEIEEEVEASLLQSLSQNFSMTEEEVANTLSMSFLDLVTHTLKESMSQVESSIRASLAASPESENAQNKLIDAQRMNERLQDLYKELFMYKKEVHSEDLEEAVRAFTHNVGASITRATADDEVLSQAWSQLKDSAIALIRFSDTGEENPRASERLFRKEAKLDRLEGAAFDKGNKWNGLSKKDRGSFWNQLTVGRPASKAKTKRAKYLDEQVKPVQDDLDRQIKSWLESSPEWERFMVTYKVFIGVLEQQIPGFKLTNAALPAQLTAWLNKRVLQRARAANS